MGDRERIVRLGLLQVGVLQVGLAIWEGFFSRSFYDVLGPYETFNRHYLQDVSAFEGAIGVAALLALGRPAWRVGVLVVAAFHVGLHAISHLVDINEADPEWLGYVEFVLLAIGGVLLAGLARMAAQIALSEARR